MARALMDGSGNARPMPTLSAMLASTALATEAYTAWVASADTQADRRLLAEAVHAFAEQLRSAQVLVAIGYSFSDVYINEIVEQRMRETNSCSTPRRTT